MDLLAQLVGTKGMWCLTVSEECDKSAKEPGLADLCQAHDIFGEPLVPEEQKEHLAVQRYRHMLRTAGQPVDQSKNMGEAETLALIECRGIRAIFVTDDGSVADVAPHNDPQVVGTWIMLRAAHRAGFASADELWGYSRTLHAAGRHTPPTGPFDRGAFNDWLKG